jgi:hypothetical protein
MYLLYKLANNFLCYLWNQNKSIPLLKYRKIQNIDGIALNFDFTHSTTHLGDRLFFFPLIRALYDKNIPIKITDNGLTERLFYSIYGIHLLNSESETYLCISPKPSFLSFFKKYGKYIVCDFTDLAVTSKISEELIHSFNSLFDLNLVYNVSIVNKPFDSLKNPLLTKNNDYIIFNNYINSGFFRTHFLDKTLLNKKCIDLKCLGYKVVHVGSMQDKDNDREVYDFVDIDLRGILPIEDLVLLLGSSNVLEIVTFDNFIMHLGHIFQKSTWVLFRGRFNISHYLHHINYVNNTFLIKGEVKYL